MAELDFRNSKIRQSGLLNSDSGNAIKIDMSSKKPLLSGGAEESWPGAAADVAVAAGSVTMLESPALFYEEIISGIRKAKNRILLCALYFGADQTELKIIDEVRLALLRNKELHLRVLLDFSRSARKVDSSLLQLQDLKYLFESRVEISLYHMPVLHGVLRFLPSPLNEAVGVFHCKYSVFDDTVLISGANLSKNYFTNRQDRYMLVQDSCALAGFLESFYLAVMPSCYSVRRLGGPQPPSNSNSFALKNQLNKLCSQFSSMLDTCSSAGTSAWMTDTILSPILQHSSIECNAERDSTLELLSRGTWREIVLSSPYCSYTPAVSLALRKASLSGTKICILASSSEAHGFHGAKGFKSLIPELHDISLGNLMRSLNDLPNVTTMVYNRPGWSYHAKGLWCFPNDCSLPVVSYIGSSNGGERSWLRDFELGFLLSTRNPSLKQSLVADIDSLKVHCKVVRSEQELTRPIKMLQLKRILHKYVKSFL